MERHIVTHPSSAAAALLVDLCRKGVEVRASGDRVLYRPRSRVTPALAQAIAAHEADLLALLAPGPPSWRETPACTSSERDLLTHAGVALDDLLLVKRVKATFGATIVSVQVDEPPPHSVQKRLDFRATDRPDGNTRPHIAGG